MIRERVRQARFHRQADLGSDARGRSCSGVRYGSSIDAWRFTRFEKPLVGGVNRRLPMRIVSLLRST